MTQKVLGRRNAPFYISLLLLVSVYLCACLFEAFLTDSCTPEDPLGKWPNTKYRGGKCLAKRHAILLGLNKLECEFGRRIIFSIFLGLIVGYERRSADRPAGLKLMSSVSLGSCCFTVTSMFAFQTGYMSWDAARVAAAIPSGVGFLGAGVICKGFVTRGDNQVHEVHGLTTAASIWLSSALGVLSAGGLYFAALFSVGCAVALMRFGPRNPPPPPDYDTESEEDGEPYGLPDSVVDDDHAPASRLSRDLARSSKEFSRGSREFVRGSREYARSSLSNMSREGLAINTQLNLTDSVVLVSGQLVETPGSRSRQSEPGTPGREREREFSSPAGLRQRPPPAYLRTET